jgi:signal transduction histidine kinase
VTDFPDPPVASVRCGTSNAVSARPARFTVEFFSEAAHELRAPLTSIQGYVDYLLEGIAGELNPVQREFLERARTNTIRLMTLIGDLLDLLRADTGCVVPRVATFPLDEELKAVIADSALQTEGHVIELVADESASVRADREMVRRVLAILVRRAVARTADGTRIQMHLNVTAPDAVVIAMSQPGSVQTGDDLLTGFEGGDATHQNGTSGLELSLAHAWVELLGGKVWAETPPGGTPAICVALPRALHESAS